MTSNVDAAEIDKFSQWADRWWDSEGDMAPLHAINPLRTDYIT
ncbi:bifunctional 3-demethylubiquinol 3-O-methyltransferase/2-polyprenyl-6-hydroxyphenol methylase, partial [bacterium]|nr:bifunctional 3-demethylubiquinol 3-O-methyltransferase/2-polyprenyl-6-hydroxyphenol methylase [bacterium]